MSLAPSSTQACERLVARGGIRRFARGGRHWWSIARSDARARHPARRPGGQRACARLPPEDPLSLFRAGGARTAMPPRKHLAPRSASRSPDDGQMDRQMCELPLRPLARRGTGRWYLLRRCRRRRRRRRHRRRGARTRGELKKNTNFRTRGRRERARTSARVRSSPSASAMVLRRLMEPRRVDVSSWRSSSIRIAMGYSVSSPSAMPAAPRARARCPPAPSPLPPALREARRARARARPRALPAPGRAGKRGGETASPPPPRALARATVAPGAGRGAWRGPTPPLPLPSARAREPLHWGGRLLYFDFRFFSTRVYVHLLLHERIAFFFFFAVSAQLWLDGAGAPSVLSNLCCTVQDVSVSALTKLGILWWQSDRVCSHAIDGCRAGAGAAELGHGDAGRRPAAAAGLRCARAREADGRGAGRWRPSRAQSGGSLVAGAAAHRRRGEGRREGRQR